LVSSSRTTSSDTTRSGDTWVNVIPKKSARNGGWGVDDDLLIHECIPDDEKELIETSP